MIANVTPTIKKGYLTKQGGFVPSWKRRWFILKKDALSYYANELDVVPLGTANLQLYKLIRDVNIPKHEFCFALVPRQKGERSYYICAEDATEYQEWLSVLKVLHLFSAFK